MGIKTEMRAQIKKTPGWRLMERRFVFVLQRLGNEEELKTY